MAIRLQAPRLTFLLSCSLLITPAVAQEASVAPAAVAPAAVAPAAAPLILRQDTPVEMMATSEIRSDRAPAGTMFKLRINKPISVDGKTVVPVGGSAFAEVTAAKSSGGLGHSGTMSTKLLYVKAGDIQIPLEGEASAKGTGAGSAGVAILFSWAGFFHRGNNAKIKAGELVTGFVGKDMAFDLSDGTVREVPIPVAASVVPQAPSVSTPASQP
jgi:hypothetical protein